MSASPSAIEHQARQFTSAQCEALAYLELPSSVDGHIFEVILEQLADEMRMSEAEWDLFASTARLQFFGSDASKADRTRWGDLVEASTAQLIAEWNADAEAQVADYRHDAARDAA